MVTFEDGDPERPVILGCVWNGVDTAPTEDFWGGEYGPNDVKRIVTKSGNRIQMRALAGPWVMWWGPHVADQAFGHEPTPTHFVDREHNPYKNQ